MTAQRRVMAGVEQAARSFLNWLARLAIVIAPPLLRIALAVPFFNSGLTKWQGFLSLSPAIAFLFEEEFKLHLFAATYDLPAPATLAFVTAILEMVLPAMLVLGLATRLSALGLLIMTGVIQLVVPEGWANFHLPWAGLAVTIIALGPGPLSLDHLIERSHNGVSPLSAATW